MMPPRSQRSEGIFHPVDEEKVLRLDTVLQMLNEYLATKGSNYKKIFLEDLVGKIVMTDYNKKTYRVDDVTWEESPLSTFKMRDESITYIEYYSKKYNIRIQDAGQPLLISRSKPRDIRAGMPELVYLVPELCRQTGLSDEMRANFKLMRALDTHTKIGPDKRIQKLMSFNQRFTQNNEVVKEMGTWSLKLSRDLVRFKGRQLPAESIFQGQNAKYPAGDTTEGWTREMRRWMDDIKAVAGSTWTRTAENTSLWRQLEEAYIYNRQTDKNDNN